MYHNSLTSLSAAKDGAVERITDEELDSTVLEVKGANITTTFISCPQDPAKTLGIKLPWLVLLVKNLDEQFSLEVEILDEKKEKRRFRASTFQARSTKTFFISEKIRKFSKFQAIFKN